MDIRRPTLGSLLALALMVAAAGGTSGRPAGEAVRLVGGTPQERLLADWALERYRAAGLELPPVEIHFHRDPAGCGDNSGFYHSGRLDVCSVDNTVAYSRNVVVHELAHAWSEAHLTAEDRERFLKLRGLQTWNSRQVPWGLRGSEQAAEIITWGLTDGALTVLVPSDDAPEQLRSAYELLTGRPPLEAATQPAVAETPPRATNRGGRSVETRDWRFGCFSQLRTQPGVTLTA